MEQYLLRFNETILSALRASAVEPRLAEILKALTNKNRRGAENAGKEIKGFDDCGKNLLPQSVEQYLLQFNETILSALRASAVKPHFAEIP